MPSGFEGPGARAPGRKRWIVGALVAIAVGTAAGQFIPMIAAAVHEAGRNGHPGDLLPTERASGLSVAGAFAAISDGSAPPKDILDALAVPYGSDETGTANYDGGAGTFDRAVDFSVGGSTDVLAFYRGFLPSHGWKLKGTYPVPNSKGEEVLATRAGSDGFDWTAAIADPAPGQVRPVGSASFQLRLQLAGDPG